MLHHGTFFTPREVTTGTPHTIQPQAQAQQPTSQPGVVQPSTIQQQQQQPQQPSGMPQATGRTYTRRARTNAIAIVNPNTNEEVKINEPSSGGTSIAPASSPDTATDSEAAEVH